MTEKRYQMRNTNLADERGRIYYNIQRNDGVNICQVYGKNNAKSLIDELNELHEENITIKKTLHTIINQINMDKINNNKVVYSARILFKEKEFQFIYDIYKKSLEEL